MIRLLQSRWLPLFSRKRIVIALLFMMALGFFPMSTFGAATTLTITPSSGTYTVGGTFSARVVVNAGEAINAAEATVSFPKHILEVQSVSTAGSVFTLWAITPAFSNSNGTVTFAGGLPSPGVTGNGKTVLTISFRAKAAGSARVSIGSAQVTANDGEGTNVLSGTGSATFTINQASSQPVQPSQPSQPSEPSKPVPTIRSESHADPERWYANRDASASWSARSGVKGYSAVFDQSPGTTPSEQSEGLGTSFSRTGLADGIWYLHVRAQYANGWSGVQHHAFRIDTTPPDNFLLNVERESPTSRKAVITFTTTDTSSGIERFEIRNKNDIYTTVISPLSLSDLDPGKHDIVIRALDKAENITEASTVFEVEGPKPPVLFIDVPKLRLYGEKEAVTTILVEGAIKLRGFARKTDTLRITVRSHESVFEFPVEEIIDPSPIEQAPEGYEAWSVEISPDLSPGEHTIYAKIINEEGLESAEAPIITFRVVTNVVEWKGVLIPYALIIKILFVVIVTLLLGILVLVYFMVLYRHKIAQRQIIRKRRQARRQPAKRSA